MLKTIDEFLWGPGTLALLLGTGTFLLIRMAFLPWRNLGYALRSALGQEARQPGKSGVSPFSALMTALAATMGTGNIVGVATALAAGGAGALVWMELSALLGMSTMFAECMLSVKYRRKNHRGQWCGGPMYVMEQKLGKFGKQLGVLFAVFAVCASFGIGSMTQANAVAGALNDVFGTPVRVVGMVIACVTLVVILGGIRSISGIASILIPVLGVLYLVAGLLVIIGNLERLPTAIIQMIREAFSFRAAAGGVVGTGVNAMRWGVARGVFSNEAGLGSAAIAAASAETDSPVRQAYITMTSAFFDTIVLCTVTGIAICASGMLGMTDAAGQMVDGAALTILAFRTVLGDWGAVFIAVSIGLFAFSTILGWAYQGEKAFEYLSHGRYLGWYRVAFSLTAMWGATAQLDVVFRFSDICNALMCMPNLVCLLMLSGEVVRELRSFEKRR